jgi:hypothetical protein
MTEHPLTEEMCENISCFNLLLWGDTSDGIKQDMRTAADWQLEQVIEWLKNCRYYDLFYTRDRALMIRELKKAMRPQQQEKN